ncbi:MAG TPA: hypothetical protein VN651_06480 [Gemmatimonadaceae bacterium]|nr:hypothetical protein [Gemmatimonadaceae bacterium]
MHGFMFGSAAIWRLSLITTLTVSFGQLANAQATPLRRQPRDTLAAEIVSLGQPLLWQPYALGGVSSDDWTSPRGALSAGVYRDITNPVIGLLGWRAELHAALGRGSTQGARVEAMSRMLGFGAGIDWSRHDRGPAATFSFQTPIRRGGIAGGGSMLRLDWTVAHGGELGVGFEVPIAQPLAGRTRPRKTYAGPDALAAAARPSKRAPLSATVERALVDAERSALFIEAYTSVESPASAQRLAAPMPPTYTEASDRYHAALTRAFAFAMQPNDSASAADVARQARHTLLASVILPYDALFGQVRPDGLAIGSFSAQAERQFAVWLRDSCAVDSVARAGAEAVYARWLGIVRRVHDDLLAASKDSRLVWLPPQLALTRSEYDEQAKVDALIGRAVGRPFTDGNALAYLRSSDLPVEIARSIFAARDYHVLWTHDFTGRRPSGQIDQMAYRMVADAYFPALTQAVVRYDSAGTIPAYLILVDQFFYAARDGRLWMSILENPLDAKIALPGGGADEAHLLDRQRALRAAVNASHRLQADAARAPSPRQWLHNLVKVHVNVLQPADFSFRSSRLVPGWPLIPDNIARDHRKLVVYDVTETKPFDGAAILTGIGIGEWYSSDTWEDRGYRVRGPAALEARAAVRRTLIANGLRAGDMPAPLRATEPDTTLHADTDIYVGRALQVHNDAGFAQKQSSVARAMLYSLAPPGSVIIVPDPLWVSSTWLDMLIAAAARGCRVFIIAPATPNNPNPEPQVVLLEHDAMTAALQARQRLAPQLARSGGEIRVGLFTARAPADDVTARRHEIADGLRRAPWIEALLPFDSSAVASLLSATSQSDANPGSASSIAHDEKPRAPQLHQKTQLIARPGAIAALLRQPGWENVLANAIRSQTRETAQFTDQFGYTTPAIDTAAVRRTDTLVRGFEQSLPEADRRAFSFYFTLGSQNEDPRGLALDGESTIIVSGFPAAAGLADLYFIMARSTWLDSTTDLDKLLAPPTGWMARFARRVRIAF